MWFSRRAVGLHVLIVVIVPVFAALCVWQVRRALGGNELSWAYVFEWPLLAVFAVYMWWQLLHPGRDNRLNRKVKSLDPSFNSMLERWEESKDDLERSRAREDE